MSPNPSPQGGAAKRYAKAVIGVLAEHFPDMADPATAVGAVEAITRQRLSPRDSFEFIVDNPRSARWRLKGCSGDRSRVRLAYFPVIPPGSEENDELERTVNEALSLLAAKDGDPR